MTLVRVAAVVLAAGGSRRYGADNKLLADVDGVPMVARVVDAATRSGAQPVVVVTGHEADRVRAAIDRSDAAFVHNPSFASGMVSSLQAGIGRAAAEGAQGAVIMLADMPWVNAGTVDRLIETFRENGASRICVPTSGGRKGNPVLLPADLFPQVFDLTGDVGARALIAANAARILEIPVSGDGVLRDVDTAEH